MLVFVAFARDDFDGVASEVTRCEERFFVAVVPLRLLSALRSLDATSRADELLRDEVPRDVELPLMDELSRDDDVPRRADSPRIDELSRDDVFPR